MANTINLYENSYLFHSIETKKNISSDFALMKLSQQYEYRTTSEKLWAEITVNGICKRYELDYENKKVNEIS